LNRLVVVLAFLSSLVAAVVMVGGGVSLLAIESSGMQGTGGLLALGGAIALAATMVLVFAKEGLLSGGIRSAAAIAIGIVGAAPPAVLAYVAIRFAQVPFWSPVPMLEWAALAAGLFFGVGAVAILALGHGRSEERRERSVEEEPTEVPMVHMQQIRHAQQQLRSAFEQSRKEQQRQPASATEDDEDDIRVRHV
jgi:hypothetical protein